MVGVTFVIDMKGKGSLVGIGFMVPAVVVRLLRASCSASVSKSDQEISPFTPEPK